MALDEFIRRVLAGEVVMVTMYMHPLDYAYVYSELQQRGLRMPNRVHPNQNIERGRALAEGFTP